MWDRIASVLDAQAREAGPLLPMKKDSWAKKTAAGDETQAKTLWSIFASNARCTCPKGVQALCISTEIKGVHWGWDAGGKG